MNIQKISSLLILLFIILACTSCSKLHYPQYTINSILPRESFVKIEVSLLVKDNEDQTSAPVNLGKAMASGAIVKKTSKGAYVLTADHVCKVDVPRALVDPRYSVFGGFAAFDIDNHEYKAFVFSESEKIDACILFVESLKKHPALKLKEKAPEIGDKVYNVAAPAGFFRENMIPIFEGRYSGISDGFDIYTIPATGGSSGSPIVDDRGNLVGMIFAVHRRFSHISFSPTTEDLYDFLEVIKKAPRAP